MKSLAALALAVSSLSVAAQTSVGVSIGIQQPGVYGRIDIGNVPPPVVYPQPVVVVPSPVAVYQQPVYLYVPPGHQKDWKHYCKRYAACGQPVYFVQERWVEERYREAHPGKGRGHGGDHPGRGHGRGHGKHD